MLEEKLEDNSFEALPILQSTDFREKTRTMLEQAHSQVELSRLVVHPRIRGMQVSRLLMRAGIATPSTSIAIPY